jgi:hypothetical protein
MVNLFQQGIATLSHPATLDLPKPYIKWESLHCHILLHLISPSLILSRCALTEVGIYSVVPPCHFYSKFLLYILDAAMSQASLEGVVLSSPAVDVHEAIVMILSYWVVHVFQVHF